MLKLDFIATGGNQAVADAQAADSSVLSLLIFLLSMSLIAGAVLAIMLARHISRPLSAVTKVAQAVAEGDLNVKMPELKIETKSASLSRAVGVMVHSLREVIEKF